MSSRQIEEMALYFEARANVLEKLASKRKFASQDRNNFQGQAQAFREAAAYAWRQKMRST